MYNYFELLSAFNNIRGARPRSSDVINRHMSYTTPRISGGLPGSQSQGGSRSLVQVWMLENWGRVVLKGTEVVEKG